MTALVTKLTTMVVEGHISLSYVEHSFPLHREEVRKRIAAPDDLLRQRMKKRLRCIK